ncbi:alpha/beta fold hydrolase [Cellulomonas soli]|uniref:Hydrolase n=1 Tax=Cellulomonas soli TaxID=931535 RepID=A0A512PA20_9CELL|nr:alpha/beta fold hydrolase [Cellulomonas soli]NYI60539.1 pimeloyl-ACP methyl ester carboxylesterase [Cellulomonas soli]GEP68054.1 hydrolase [Cellulomonas soli]
MTHDTHHHLAAEAADLGLHAPLPALRRVTTPTPDGRISALAWHDEPARVVLLHGAALNAHTWDGTLLHWDVPALAVDLPGHGESDWRTDGDYRPTTLAPALLDALRTWQSEGLLAERPVLVGQSLGGLTAVRVAAGLPSRRVVLVDILPVPPGAAVEVAQFLAGPTSFASREEIVERALAFGLGGSRSRLARAVELNTRIAPDGSVVWKHHLATLGPAAIPDLDVPGSWAAIGALESPLDLVLASRSLVGQASVDELARLRPQARVLRVGAGHNVQEDAPRALAEVLVQVAGADVS